jgi:hypothetical protein
MKIKLSFFVKKNISEENCIRYWYECKWIYSSCLSYTKWGIFIEVLTSAFRQYPNDRSFIWGPRLLSTMLCVPWLGGGGEEQVSAATPGEQIVPPTSSQDQVVLWIEVGGSNKTGSNCSLVTGSCPRKRSLHLNMSSEQRWLHQNKSLSTTY